MKSTDLVDHASLRDRHPRLRPRRRAEGARQVVEGSKERVQVFQGNVIAPPGQRRGETFTVRKLSYGVGVERTFPRPLADRRQGRGRPPRRRAPRQAVLPARSHREGRQDQGEARPLSVRSPSHRLQAPR